MKSPAWIADTAALATFSARPFSNAGSLLEITLVTPSTAAHEVDTASQFEPATSTLTWVTEEGEEVGTKSGDGRGLGEKVRGEGGEDSGLVKFILSGIGRTPRPVGQQP